MDIFWIELPALAIVYVIFQIISELSSWLTVGGLIKEKDLDVFFEKHLATYKENDASESMLHGDNSLPYVSRSISSPLSRWYISNGPGRIPRWSKWNKELDSIISSKAVKLNDY